MNFAVLAAGKGERLCREGAVVAKPLIDIGGKPMIVRLLDILAPHAGDAGTISVVVNIHRQEVAATLRQWADTHAFTRLRMVEADPPDSFLSFCELSSAIPAGKFVLTTVDTVFDPTRFGAYVAEWERDSAHDALMGVTATVDDEKPLYVAVDPRMNVVAFNDTDSASSGTPYVSAGVYGLSDRAIATLCRCRAAGVGRLRNYQRALLADSLLVGAYDLGAVIDVDHLTDVAKASRLSNNTIYG